MFKIKQGEKCVWETLLLRQKVVRGIHKMLTVVKNVTWWQRITDEVTYTGLPTISTTIRERRYDSAVTAGGVKMKLLAIWFCGN